MKERKLKIALVNQRYGLEVNGGSEYYTRQLAEHMSGEYNVEILTTKALDYMTWENYYKEDVEEINGITIRRFDVEHPRNVFGFRVWMRAQRTFPIGSVPPLKKFCENKWIDAQGPFAPGLIRYIEEHAGDYDLFIFVTYLYYHSVRGLPKVAGKAVLLPTAHDEPFIYFSIFKELFEKSRGLIYLTPEEKTFAESLFDVKNKPNCICGSGVDLPEDINEKRFREKYNIKEEYFIYVGRVDQSKGCGEMFDIFRKYKDEHPEDSHKLVLMGKAAMDVPEDENILPLGFVPEEDKFDGIKGADALWLPSKFESLSIAVLEAFSLGVPVIVNGKCEVLKGHIDRSGAGFYYTSKDEAKEALMRLSDKEERKRMSGKAEEYIEKNYKWSGVLDKIAGLISEICG